MSDRTSQHARTRAREQIRASLHELARPVAGDLHRDRRRRAGIEAANLAAWTLVVFPCGYLVVTSFAALAGADARLAWYLALPLCLVVPVIVIVRRVMAAGRASVSDASALAEIDRQLELRDRLSAAREFVDVEEPDGFMQAAINDAESRIEAARATTSAVHAAQPRLQPKLAGYFAVALALLFAASQLGGRAVGVPAPPEGQLDVAVVPSSTTDEPEQSELPPRQPRAKEPFRERPTAEQQAGDTAGDDGSPTTQNRKGRNALGAGRSAEARTSAGGGSERGQPSNQAQSTKGSDSSKPKPKKDKPERDEKERRDEKPPKPQEQSGATQGRGSGRGSSRSPTATPWASKDQVVSDEQEEIEEDEEVDDENDESEARGGVQPNLRQRKPPVNRDLMIAMGNGQPNEDSNGRGGPGGPKKQRGVAQLVLGVTFPDHVTAPPNPGMSKVTQERIDPQTQQSDAVPGEDRGKRDAPMGHLSSRILSPWMQDLVRKFYLSIRDSRTE